MPVNVGTLDRIVRLVFAIILAAVFVFAPSPFRWIGLIAAIPLLTGAIAFCPLYSLFGVNTCGVRR